MPSFFWAGLLIGRAAAPAVLRRVSEAALVLISLFVAGAGLVVILVGSSLMTVSSGAGLAGLGLAAVFPTTFAIFTRQFGRQASQLTGFVFVLGGMGGALIPWLVGLHFGPVWGFTHRTSHSTVLRGVYDCLANRYYPGVGSGAFAKSPISIVLRNRSTSLNSLVIELSHSSTPWFSPKCGRSDASGSEARRDLHISRENVNSRPTAENFARRGVASLLFRDGTRQGLSQLENHLFHSN